MHFTPPPQRTANFSTLCLLALKDVRLERGLHQSHIAQQVGKTPSAWAKIESGQSPLQVDTLFGACFAMNINPSQFLAVVERLAQAFNFHNWYLTAADLQGEDELLPLVQEYFASSGFENLKYRPNERLSVQAFSNTFSSAILPTIVQYCCFTQVKAWIDAGAPNQNNPQTEGSTVGMMNLATTATAGVHNPSI